MARKDSHARENPSKSKETGKNCFIVSGKKGKKKEFHRRKREILTKIRTSIDKSRVRQCERSEQKLKLFYVQTLFRQVLDTFRSILGQVFITFLSVFYQFFITLKTQYRRIRKRDLTFFQKKLTISPAKNFHRFAVGTMLALIVPPYNQI